MKENTISKISNPLDSNDIHYLKLHVEAMNKLGWSLLHVSPGNDKYERWETMFWERSKVKRCFKCNSDTQICMGECFKCYCANTGEFYE